MYIEWSHAITSKTPVFHSLVILFVLANSVGPVEMPHYVAFHLGLHCLTNYVRI